MKLTFALSLAALSLAALVACVPIAAAAPLGPIDPRFVSAIVRATAAYPGWHRVDEHPNIAPGLCRAPLPEDYGKPSDVRMSDADDSPHGKKLYYLWASDRAVYAPREAHPDAPVVAPAPIPVGFTIVKESFAAVPMAHAPPMLAELGHAFGGHFEWREMGYLPPISSMSTADGHLFQTGDRKDLYVMVKVGDQPGSDDGWVYGTVAPDGHVSSAGRVATCMHCHDESATREKLFGLQPLPARAPAPPRPR